MYNLVFLVLVLVFACSHAAVNITIDLQRNVWGTTANTLKAFDNVDNSIYFKATGAESVSSWSFVDQTLNPLQLSSIDHVLDTENSEKLIVATMKPTGSRDVILQGFHSNGTLLGSFSFTIENPHNPQIVSCTNDKLKLYIPDTYNMTYLALNGQEGNSDCSFRVVLPSSAPTTPHNLEVPMAACGLQYFVQFQISLREHEEFNVDQDFNSLMTCGKISLVTTLTAEIQGSYGAPDTQVLFEQGVLGSMYVHARGDPQATITNGVAVGTPVTLRISLGELYKFNFDILPLQCTVNNVLISTSSCSINPTIFGEFTKHSIGELSSDFNMFRVVDSVTKIPSNSINIQCTLYVGTVDTSTGESQAPISPCINYE